MDLATGEQYGAGCVVFPEPVLFKTTDIINKLEDIEVSIYPNPTTVNLNIRLSDGNPSVTECNIYNTAGQKIVSSALNNTLNQIPVNHLVPGLYIIELLKQDKRRLQKIIIK